MKITTRAVVANALFAILGAPLASVAAENYAPAMFDFEGEQLAKRILVTEKQSFSGTTVVLYCQSDLSAQGEAMRTSCYDQEGNAELVSATESAMKDFAFTPASVNGQAVPVRMSYRVGFNQQDSRKNALLIPNLGSMHERYGRDYVAPQERLDVSDWVEKYNKNSWVNGEAFLGDGSLSRVAATVNAEGKTDVVRTLDAERAYKRDAIIVRNALKKSRFIPGFVDGKPVPMGYLAVVNYGDQSGEAVSSR